MAERHEGESMKPRKSVARLGNEQIERSVSTEVKQIQGTELGELKEKSPPQYEMFVYEFTQLI